MVLFVDLWGVISGVHVLLYFSDTCILLTEYLLEVDGIPGELLHGKHRAVRFFLVAMQVFHIEIGSKSNILKR